VDGVINRPVSVVCVLIEPNPNPLLNLKNLSTSQLIDNYSVSWQVNCIPFVLLEEVLTKLYRRAFKGAGMR